VPSYIYILYDIYIYLFVYPDLAPILFPLITHPNRRVHSRYNYYYIFFLRYNYEQKRLLIILNKNERKNMKIYLVAFCCLRCDKVDTYLGSDLR